MSEKSFRKSRSLKKNELTLGAHKSASGGYEKAVERVAEIGGNCLQIFSLSPRGWKSRKIEDIDEKAFRVARKEHGIEQVYFHACYLINLADDGETGRKSVENLINELQLAAKVGVRGSVIHTGSYKKKTKDSESANHKPSETLIKNIKEVLANTPQNTLMILENSGTRKIGKDIEELAKIIKAVKSKRIRICLDTCHLHAAGYDLSSEKKFKDFFKNFDKTIGLDRLELIHMNDSRDALGSLRDRHENINEGNIPASVFKLFLTRPETKDKAFVIETPGFGTHGPDQKNLDRLKKMNS